MAKKVKREHPLLSPANFVLCSSYLLVIGILAALAVEVNKEHQWVSQDTFAGILLALVVVGAFLVSRLFRRLWRGRPLTQLHIEEKVRPRKALIAFVSKEPGRTSALEAALYHAAGGHLRHLWLITAHDAAEHAEWVRQEVQQRHKLTVHKTAFLEDPNSIREAKQLVEHLRNVAVREHHISEDEVMCDFTGLTKGASAGMILACAPRKALLQYMHPKRFSEEGRADPAAGSTPRQVMLAYQIEEDEEEE